MVLCTYYSECKVNYTWEDAISDYYISFYLLNTVL